MTLKLPTCLPIATFLAVGGIHGILAASPLPAWYGEPRSTRTGYTFGTNSQTPVANLSENLFGNPVATVVLGPFADGWQDPAGQYDLSGVNNDGAWDLGMAGSISVSVPFAPAVPLAGMYYDVNFQVYTVAYRGITSLPTFDSLGLTAMDLVLTQATVAVDPGFPGATWEGLKWTGRFDHVTANNVGFAVKAPANNTSVVDSFEIFTQYTWHSSDPLARIWDGRDVDDNLWSSKDNWGGIAPVAGDSLYFAGGLRLTPENNLAAGTSFGGITFLADAGAFTLSGNEITLAGGVSNLSNNLQTIQLPVVLSGVSTFATNGAAGGITIDGAISGINGGIIKTGDGTLKLNAVNTYQGNTTVSVGTLALAGAGSIGSSPMISVASGAVFDVSAVNDVTWTLGSEQTLTGEGDVNGNIRISGTLAPGSGIGEISIDGDLNFASDSIFEWQMSDAIGSEGDRGTQYDAVNLTGTLDGADSVFKIVLDGADNFDQEFWNVQRVWSDIFSSEGTPLAISTFFSSFAYANAEGDLLTPSAATRGTFSFSGSSLVWSAVPEPSNMAVGLLLASLWWRRRRPIKRA